jgi:hypothetical protein
MNLTDWRSTETENQTDSQYRPGLEKRITDIMTRLTSTEQPAPPYPQSEGDHLEKEKVAEKKDPAEATSSSPKRLTPPNSVGPPSSQNSLCTSVRACSRSSDGSMASVPNSALSEGRVIWCCQQHWQQSSFSQGSLAHSNYSRNIDNETVRHNHQAGSDDDIHASQCAETISITNSSPRSSVQPVDIRDHSSTGGEDVESQRHRDVLTRRARFSPTRKWVKYLSMFVALLALIGMVLILSLQQSKTMARAGFTVCTTLAYFCVAAGMWAADRTMVETFIAMNLVVVYGIFLNGQIDVFLDYATNS